MADQVADSASDLEEEEGAQDSAGSEDGGAKGSKLKKLLLFVVLPLVLLGGGAAGAYFSGLADGLLGITPPAEEAESEEETVETAAFFLELPEMLVNLNSGRGKSSYLKITVSLELAGAGDAPQVEQVMPRIVDNFQVYLRELHIEDLKGSKGLHRLREELLARVNAAVSPLEVRDVLFKEMLVQ